MRILLFIAMQIAILVVVSIVGSLLLNVFGIYLDRQSYAGLLCLFAVYGFTGSLISLFASKWICKSSYRVRIIDVPTNDQERFLVETVAQFARQYDLKMPEVGIYSSADPNAFATGASRDGAMVAVSTGLLNSMSRNEIRGVLGHEMSHVHNGDMVTMALLQGVLNTFVYFISYLVSVAVVNAMQGKNDRRSIGFSPLYYMINSLCQILFGFIASIILMAYSRHREFKADAGSAALTGRNDMISALRALQRAVQPDKSMKASMSALCINAPAAVSELLRSHPPLEKRIEALEKLNV
ncbi:MAG: protease HtpX [Succinivibrio sp.]|nr:protease HtpX [Succinivibrio sp.]